LTETQKVLLSEVNHRVKNNLYAITGILNKEKSKIKENKYTSELDFIDDLIHRVESLSSVHSQLSASYWKPLKISELCNNLASNLLSNINKEKEVQLIINHSRIEVNSRQAQQIALVVNEILTNMLKYSKIPFDNLKINITAKLNKDKISITIKDNGVGFPQEILDGDYTKTGIGFNLIFGIIEKSLAGSVSLSNDNGAVYKLTILREKV